MRRVFAQEFLVDVQGVSCTLPILRVGPRRGPRARPHMRETIGERATHLLATWALEACAPVESECVHYRGYARSPNAAAVAQLLAPPAQPAVSAWAALGYAIESAVGASSLLPRGALLDMSQPPAPPNNFQGPRPAASGGRGGGPRPGGQPPRPMQMPRGARRRLNARLRPACAAAGPKDAHSLITLRLCPQVHKACLSAGHRQ